MLIRNKNLLIILMFTPSVAYADSGKWAFGLLFIVVFSLFPYFSGISRIYHDEKEQNCEIRGSVFIYTMITFLVGVPMLLAAHNAENTLIHYSILFAVPFVGPIIGFISFHYALMDKIRKKHIKENNSMQHDE